MGAHHHHAHTHTAPSKVRLFLLKLVHSNSYVAVPITAITLSTYLQAGAFDLNFNYLLFLFFSTLFLYPLHRLVGLKLTIPVGYTKAQRAVDKSPIIAQSSVLLGFIGAIFFASQLTIDTVQLLLPLGIISITYSIPLIPTTNGWKRLRDLPRLKIYGIAFVVTFTTSSIPLILMQEFNTQDIILMGAQRFLFVLAVTIPFDIRDIILDKRWNLQTIPLIIGSEKSIKLAIVLVYLSASISIFQWWFTSIFDIYMVIAVGLSSAWAAFILKHFQNNNSPLYNAFLVEGTLVFQFALVTIAGIITSIF